MVEESQNRARRVTISLLSWLGYLVPVGLLCAGSFYIGTLYGAEFERSDGPRSPPMTSRTPAELSYGDHMHEMADAERQNPMDFLELRDFEASSRFLSGSKDIDCIIYNSAFTTGYSNLKVDIVCYDEMRNHVQTIHREFDKGIGVRRTEKLSTRIDPPSGATRYRVELVGARPDR